MKEEEKKEAPKEEPKTEAASAPPKKKKLNRADYTFKDKKGEVLVKNSGDINGLQFFIKDLEDCTVVLLDHIAQLSIDRCKGCRFFLGPIKASIFVRDCSGCDVVTSCGQFRSRDLIDSTVYLYTPNDPIIESSSGVVFAPYNFKYPRLREHAEAADLIGEYKDDDGIMQKRVNKWNLVFDFTKRDDGKLNYSIQDQKDFDVVTHRDL